MSILEVIGLASLIVWLPMGAFLTAALILERWVKFHPGEWLEFKKWKGRQ